MLVVLTETYCNKVNSQITQRDDFIQNGFQFVQNISKRLSHLDAMYSRKLRFRYTRPIPILADRPLKNYLHATDFTF